MVQSDEAKWGWWERLKQGLEMLRAGMHGVTSCWVACLSAIYPMAWLPCTRHSVRQAWREWSWIRTPVTAGCWALQRAAILPICPLPDAEVTHRFLSVSREDRTKRCFESSALLRTCLPTALKRRGEGQVWEGSPGTDSIRTE